jgi:phosphatidylglycerophosphate synthase
MSEFFWLNALTASRTLCGLLWLWCWWKRPKWMVAYMAAAAAWFIGTDWYDGMWARNRGLVSELGYWLDHGADFLFYGALVLAIIRGSREPEMRRRPKRIAPPRATASGAAGAPPATGEAPPPTLPPSPPA